MLLLMVEQSLEVVEPFCHHEINHCHITQGEIFPSHIIFELVEFRFDFFESSSYLSRVLSAKQRSQCFLVISPHTKNVFNKSLVSDIFAKELRFEAFRDVLDRGNGFSELIVAIDEIGHVGEIKAEVLFVLFKPFLPGLVLHFFEVSADIGEQVTDMLSKASGLPIAKDKFSHDN